MDWLLFYRQSSKMLSLRELRQIKTLYLVSITATTWGYRVAHGCDVQQLFHIELPLSASMFLAICGHFNMSWLLCNALICSNFKKGIFQWLTRSISSTVCVYQEFWMGLANLLPPLKDREWWCLRRQTDITSVMRPQETIWSLNSHGDMYYDFCPKLTQLLCMKEVEPNNLLLMANALGGTCSWIVSPLSLFRLVGMTYVVVGL